MTASIRRWVAFLASVLTIEPPATGGRICWPSTSVITSARPPVTDRTAAVDRARELRLLSAGRT